MKYLTFLDYSTLESTDINIETKLYEKKSSYTLHQEHQYILYDRKKDR
jgi:hypothetical protein